MASRKEGKSKSTTMDLNLYLGPTPCSPPRNHAMCSDLSLNSFIRTTFSDSREIRVPEATPMAIEAVSSHASNVFFVESNVPSDIPLPQVFENPIPPSYESTCAQRIEGSGMLQSLSNTQILQYEYLFGEIEQGLKKRQKSSVDLRRNYFDFYNSVIGNASQQDLFEPPESPNQGWFQSNFCYQNSLMPSLLDGNEGTNLSRFSSTNNHELLMDETLSSEESLDLNRANPLSEVGTEDKSEIEAEENNRCGSNFQCNICIDIAKEPIVTSCGHLFCCCCLYQWLYVNSDCNECPVCKGQVSDANIIPIYGRGCTKSDDNKDEEIYSRQSFYRISQGIGGGIANPRGGFPDYQIPISNRFSMVEDSFNHQFSSELQEEQSISEGEPSTVGILDLLNNDHLVAMDCENESAFGRFTENSNFYGSTVSVNSPNPGQFTSVPVVGARPDADQAFSSSTVAVMSRESSTRISQHNLIVIDLLGHLEK